MITCQHSLGDMEVVENEFVSGQLIPITISDVDYWVTIAYNHVRLVLF
jgi:hypothetical protein